MIPSHYAKAAQERGLDIITWTLERAGPGQSGFFWSSTDGIVDLSEGDRFTYLKVLHEDVGVLGVFSGWPATSTFYANCMDLKLRATSRGQKTEK
jgi:glycerophosphoryl diester phosphodiesterase